MNPTNPLFQESPLLDNAVCFSKIKPEHFLPALDHAIDLAKSNIAAIKNAPEQITFKNTSEALEVSAEEVERVSGVFHYLYSAEGPDEIHALAKEIAPKLATFGSDVSLDPILFERIKKLYETRHTLKLNTEEARLLEKQYHDFVRNGALLNEEQKNQLRAIDQELASLAPLFSENVLRATNKFEMVITNENDLEGLPEGAREAAKSLADAKGLTNSWLFNLQYPSFAPFMQYASNRKLREQLWRAHNTKCFNDDYDNQQNILKIVNLRNQRAQLLGYKTHAAFVLEERMAQTPEKVMTFLDALYGPYRKAAEKDIAELKEFKKSFDRGNNFDGHSNEELMPWDYAFYSEKLKEQKYSFNSEELRPYFPLDKCVQGIFEHAQRLFDLKFQPATNIEVYHPDVKVYEVRDVKTNDFVALFYTDLFPRETKKSGAWATTLREQGLYQGILRRPHAAIVCNFTKPTPSKPSLLTFDEVSTLFHEFGHALHMMLSQCRYHSLSGANVYWDFVELPSQIMENWIDHQESLDIFAHHYQTGKPLPQELVKKINDSSLFQIGYFSLRQLAFCYLDMAWHSSDLSQITSLIDFEKRVTEKTRLLPWIEGSCVSTHFSHIFAGGYSAGYYSYKWAEVLDADAFEYFQEEGLFNRDIGQKFKDTILSRGGTEHPMEIYKNFRGREPDHQALLRREGLL